MSDVSDTVVDVSPKRIVWARRRRAHTMLPGETPAT